VTERPRNVVPGRYRGVAVSRVDVALDEASLRDHFVGKPAYFKTRFIVVHNAGGTAIAAVTKPESDDLFTPITSFERVTGPDETAFVHAPDVDTAVPSELARAAREQAPTSYAVVVQGLYEHINFILGADPLRVTVREVVPPRPAKLLDQAERLLRVREDLPPIQLVPELLDLAAVAADAQADGFLLPCRGSGFTAGGRPVYYLDEHPERQPWLLLGCTRSQQIHTAFYGEPAPAVSICPAEREDDDRPVLSKCCLQDSHLERRKGTVSVPWGSTLEQVSDALDMLVDVEGAAWRPV
jgi:hypothetical protein